VRMRHRSLSTASPAPPSPCCFAANRDLLPRRQSRGLRMGASASGFCRRRDGEDEELLPLDLVGGRREGVLEAGPSAVEDGT
jgi:hypothetical protein